MNREKIQFEKKQETIEQSYTWSALLVIFDKDSLWAYFLDIWSLCGGCVCQDI